MLNHLLLEKDGGIESKNDYIIRYVREDIHNPISNCTRHTLKLTPIKRLHLEEESIIEKFSK